jgi:hypothetical protein
VLTGAKNDGDGPFAAAADQRQPSLEWGPASGDTRHRMSGTVAAQLTPNSLWAAVSFVAAAGAPYTMTTGTEANKEGLFNDRPSGVHQNSLRGAGYRTVDLHVQWRTRNAASPGNTPGRRPPSWGVRLDVRNLLNETKWSPSASATCAV